VTTLASLLGGYPVLLALLAAVDRAAGWPLADAFGRPH
jgi:hypothetical protein